MIYRVRCREKTTNLYHVATRNREQGVNCCSQLSPLHFPIHLTLYRYSSVLPGKSLHTTPSHLFFELQVLEVSGSCIKAVNKRNLSPI